MQPAIANHIQEEILRSESRGAKSKDVSYSLKYRIPGWAHKIICLFLVVNFVSILTALEGKLHLYEAYVEYFPFS